MPTTKTKDTTASLRLPTGLKKRLDATGNLKAYLREAAERRLSRYRAARDYLRHWPKNELLAIMDSLNGHAFTFGFDIRLDLAATMEECNEAREAWGVDKERWEALIKDVESDEPTARALYVLAEELHSKASDHVDL